MRSDERHFYEKQPEPPRKNGVRRTIVAVTSAVGALVFAAVMTDLVDQPVDIQTPGEQDILQYENHDDTLSASE